MWPIQGCTSSIPGGPQRESCGFTRSACEPGQGRDVAHLGHFPVGGQMECHAQGDEGPERMAAFLELCPIDIKDQVFFRIDEIKENYAVLRGE